jgi:hypothetical protein
LVRQVEDLQALAAAQSLANPGELLEQRRLATRVTHNRFWAAGQPVSTTGLVAPGDVDGRPRHSGRL